MHPRTVILNSEQGFTLAETAMVLAILAVVIGTLVPSFLSIRVSEQARTTSQNLQTVMRSIAAFVQSSGCLPCPTPASAAFSNGHGYVAGGNGTACGTCSNPTGLLPFRSLGLPEALAKDAYGHWLTYAVDTRLASYVASAPNTQLPVSGTNGLCSVTMATAAPLDIQLSNGSHQSNIAAMVLSHGANGYGAYRNNPNDGRLAFPNATPACSGTTGAERCNARDNNRNFITPIAAVGNDPFDDNYLYLDRNSLVSYLGNPACTTGWP